MNCHYFTQSITRRNMLRASAGGFGSFVLSALAGKSALGASQPATDPIFPPVPHFRPRAKRVIFLFMWGGPSHMDMFDPKPRLNTEAGKELLGETIGSKKDNLGKVLGSPFTFRQHGQGGIWMNDLLPHLSRHADRMCVIRSMHTEGNAHGEALLRLHTGQANLVRPSVGAWISYGLGRENENLPAFITISPPRGHGGVQNYGNSFLPANHQGMAIGSAEIPIAKAVVSNLSNPQITSAGQRGQLGLIQALNRRHLDAVSHDPRIEGIIANYELAFRMQSTMPAIMDVSDETSQTLDQYGIGSGPTDNFGRQCLLARKFAERGVRYIQVSTDYTWDHHKKVKEGTVEECAKVDKPIAGLLDDLAQCGLLEDTLVLWGGEFGRTPMVENGDGRNHHPNAFSMWMAGGGVRGGLTYGSTDDFGYSPVEKPVHMHDLHATLLHTLGLDHTRLTYNYAGRDFRLTDVFGKVVHEILA